MCTLIYIINKVYINMCTLKYGESKESLQPNLQNIGLKI